MERARRDRTGDMVSMLPQSISCGECTADDPQIRARHHLALAKDGGLDLLKPHLYQHYAQSPRITTDERREAIESLCGWVAGLMRQWSGFADETTGAPLPWWEARRQFTGRAESIAVASYAQAPETYRRRHPREGASFPAVAGFRQLSSEPIGAETESTLRRGQPDEHEYLPEPGEYTQDPEETTHADC